MKFFLYSLFLLSAACFSSQGFTDPIFKEAVENALNDCPIGLSNVQKANYLIRRIDVIGLAAIQRGFDLSGYAPKSCQTTPSISFAVYPVWEGGAYGIPLTFIIYAWPAEKMALEINPSHQWYRSNIHSHPIECALTILKGSLIEESYREVKGLNCPTAQLLNRKTLNEGMSSFDDLSDGSIHRLVCRDVDGGNCISLHAYALPTANEVWKCFRETFSQCSYPNVLLEDGRVVRDWQ